MNFGFVGGSMGSAVGEGDHARGGARARAADAAPRRLHLRRRAHAGGLPLAHADGEDERRRSRGCTRRACSCVSLLTDPTYGGVSASFATLGDVLIAEPQLVHRLRRPEGDRADDPPAAPRGLPDRRVPARPRDARPGRAAREPPERAAQAARAAHAPASGGLPEHRGRRADYRSGRAAEARPPGTSSSSRATSSGRTRSSTSATSSTTSRSSTATGCSTRTLPSSAASRRLGDLAVVVVGHQKGHTTSEMMERNFGMPNPEGYRKGMRLMRARGAVRHAARHLRRHAGRVPRARRGGARPVDRDRRVDHGDVAPAGPDRHARHRRGRQRAARSRSRSATGC